MSRCPAKSVSPRRAGTDAGCRRRARCRWRRWSAHPHRAGSAPDRPARGPRAGAARRGAQNRRRRLRQALRSAAHEDINLLTLLPAATAEGLQVKDSKGAIREWEISVSGSTITVLHGTKDGIKTKTTEKIIVGKNIGKKNETTREQQANLEAKSKWTKKRDSGYSENILDSNKSYRPMLANEFKKHKEKVKYPVYVQPKLDGYRMIYNGPKDKILSRTGKEFDILYGEGISMPGDVLNAGIKYGSIVNLYCQ